MVMKDLKAMMDQGGGIKEKSDNEKDDMFLFNLVRGGKDKKRVNFLVTSSEGGREYVPSRFSSLMINARKGNESFIPRRGRSGNEKGDEDPNEKKETHTRFGTPRKKRTPPGSSSSEGGDSDEEAHGVPKKKGQRKKRATSSNKQASVDSNKGLPEGRGRTSVGGSVDAPKGSTIAQESPPKEGWAWGTTDAVPFKPAWGGLKGYDDCLDDMRIDKEWGETQVWHDRMERVKRTRSGVSPPPRGMGRKSSEDSRVKSEEELRMGGQDRGG
jgi:hypothetical protein